MSICDLSHGMANLYLEIKDELIKILDFWAQRTVDDEFGGFVDQIDRYGNINR